MPAYWAGRVHLEGESKTSLSTGILCPAGDIWRRLETLLGGWVLLAFSEQRPGRLLTILQCQGQSPTSVSCLE